MEKVLYFRLNKLDTFGFGFRRGNVTSQGAPSDIVGASEENFGANSPVVFVETREKSASHETSVTLHRSVLFNLRSGPPRAVVNHFWRGRE